MWSVKQKKPKTRPILYRNVEINKQNFKYTMKTKIKKYSLLECLILTMKNKWMQYSVIKTTFQNIYIKK